MSDQLTAEERKAIAALERLAKRWPQSLKLISAAGSLVVVRMEDLPQGPDQPPLDPDKAVPIYGIPNDGGDPW